MNVSALILDLLTYTCVIVIIDVVVGARQLRCPTLIEEVMGREIDRLHSHARYGRHDHRVALKDGL